MRLDYRFTKRFDVYGGFAYSKVEDGLASGFLNTSVTTVMTGFRFNF
jgi:predicted porin